MNHRNGWRRVRRLLRPLVLVAAVALFVGFVGGAGSGGVTGVAECGGLEPASASVGVVQDALMARTPVGMVQDSAVAHTPGDGELRVVVVDVETGDELWWAPAAAGDELWYMYTHSADKTPVHSLLRVCPPPVGLVLEQERYLWYGAGLEYRRDRGVVLDGQWVVVHAKRVIGGLVLRIAGTVEQRVVVGDESTTLGQLASYGRRVMLEVRP